MRERQLIITTQDSLKATLKQLLGLANRPQDIMYPMDKYIKATTPRARRAKTDKEE
jgi:hypothetical protein